MPITLNGTTGITTPGVTNSGSETVTNTSTVGALTVNGNNISAVNSLGFRNRIINGAMVIDQRNAGASVTISSNTYTLDRWQAIQTQASKYSVQQSTTAPTGFTNSMLVTSLSAYSVGASDTFYVRQMIEGFNTADLNFGSASAQTVTLSFWVRSSLTGTFGGAIDNNGGSRSYPFTYTISAANTWEYKTVTIAGDTSGTWQTGNLVGIGVSFSLGSGSTFSGTAGAWASAAYKSATGATSVVGTNGATWYITGVQLEAGTVASPFERRDYGRELMMCQRYYEKGGMSRRSGNRASGTLESTPLFYKVMKRANPTLTLSGGYTADGWGTYAVGGHDNPSGSNDQVYFGNMECTATSTVNAGGVMACTWTSSAEL